MNGRGVGPTVEKQVTSEHCNVVVCIHPVFIFAFKNFSESMNDFKIAEKNPSTMQIISARNFLRFLYTNYHEMLDIAPVHSSPLTPPELGPIYSPVY